jgi:poly(ADP-ribose) glycohydrolase ARH3
MMIGVAESLIANRGFNGEHMALTFVKNYKQEPWREYGLGTTQVFKLIESGTPWHRASALIFCGKGSYGNGAAMRVAPVGLLFHRDIKKLRAVAFHQSGITHSHELAKEGAALQAYAVALAVRACSSEDLDSFGFLRKLRRFTRSDLYAGKLKKMTRLLGENDRSMIINQLGNGYEAHNSVPVSIFSFLCSSSFKESVQFAINLGGDMDTIGAMTGAISGAYYGVKALPRLWKTKLERADYLEHLAKQLHSVYAEDKLSNR